jgi:hypothetical protein
MPKLIITADEDYQETRDQELFLHDLGTLMMVWGCIDLYIEVEIAMIVGISHENANIMLGSLQHKAKISILYSLLIVMAETMKYQP